MESWLAQLSQHGYLILVAFVFCEAIALPVPAALALLIAGAASARGSLYSPWVLGAAISAMLAGDVLMFLMGRFTGWWLLGILCRLSLNPESCILRAADTFYRRGRTLFLFAKFVPGINTLAPPLAGSMNMRFLRFLPLDLAATLLYVGAYWSLGFLFSDALGFMTSGYQTFGRLLGWIVIALIAGYLAGQVWMWRKARNLPAVPLVDPADVARALSSGDAVIYDVRSHGYYDRKATRIQGSRRLDPNALHQVSEDFPKTKQIYLYCTCVREATSARVARDLLERGVVSAVIRGGLRAWKKAGLPVEAVPVEEIAALPVFD